MIVIAAALLQLALLFVGQEATPASAPSEKDAIRALVVAYYQAQTATDADKAAPFWSTNVNPRMSRESFLAVFGAGAAEYTPEIQALAIQGSEARVRVSVAVARTIVRNDVPTVVRQTMVNAQLWRKEGTAWKLVREGPPAEDFADQLLAAPATGRAGLLEANPLELTSGLRYVLAQRGSNLAGLMQYEKAGELFDLALLVARAAKDRRAQSETLQNIANAYYFRATRPGAAGAAALFDKAADSYRERLALGRDMADEEGIAASLLGLATVSYSRGDYTPALGYYREALAIYERRDEGTSIGRTLVSVGNIQFLQAEYDEAAASDRRALLLLIAGRDSQGATFARSGLARVFGAQGDLAAALDMYGQVLADTRAAAALDPRSKSNVVAPLESIGDIHFRLGNIDRARAAFDEARRLADPVPALAARIYGELGLTEIVAGRFETAIADYTESRARYELAKNPSGVGQAWTGIGFSHAAREKFADAIPAYRTAIRIFEAERENESAGRAWLGLSLAQSGALDHAAALESAGKVRVIAAGVRSDDLAWRAEVRAGEVLRKLARGDEALTAFRTAMTAIDRLAADAPVNPDARRQLDDSASAWSGLALALAVRGDATGALAALEARRAHIRRVQLAPFQRDISRGTTPEERAGEQAIVRELISRRMQLKAEQSNGKPDPARVERLQQELAELITKRSDQQTRLYARLPELQQWRGLSAPAVAVNSLVADNHALIVEYLVGDEELLTVSVAHADGSPDVAATVTPLARRDLADRIERATQAATLADIVEWRKQTIALAASLLGPLASRLADRDRVIVVPDDVLWRVPFEALPVGEVDFASGRRVTYATSLATLSLQRRIPAVADAEPPGRIAAGIAAAPLIPEPIRAQLALTLQGWKEPDADAALAAARDAAKPYGEAATVKTAVDASEAAARALLDHSDVMQVVAPLQMSGATPLFSSLLLAGTGEAAEIDGRWEAREWFSVQGRARVLVIPDASTLATAGVAGAMDTFAWAAAAANICSLVMGRSPDEGFAPAGFLAALHAELAQGTPIGAAWRLATISARAQAGAAPRGWAGLRLLGGGPQ